MQEVLSPKMQAFAGLRGGEEAIRYSLYHAKDFAAGALLGPYSFFNVPVGAQDPDTGGAATAEDTNMDAASLLTAPNRFMVTKINVPIGPSTLTLIPVGSAIAPGTESFKDDVTRLVWRGLFTFRLLNKEYLRLAPLGLLGAGMGVWGAVSAATTAADPPLEPPGMRVVSHGFSVGKNDEFSVEEPIANSSRFVRPRKTAPAVLSLRTTVES